MTAPIQNGTLLVRHKVDYSAARPVATPIFQTSAFRAGDPYFYTRKSNPNFEEVEGVLKALDGASDALLLSSGMAAMSAALQLLSPGDTLVVNELIYGCSHRFITDFAEHLKVTVRFLDLSRPAEIDGAVGQDVDMVILETPTNPFLRTIPIREIASRLHASNPAGLVVVDNTWATPLFQKPLQLGADVCVYSGSKFFSGHSDIILGAVTTRQPALAERLERTRFYSGAVPDPFAAWLLRRSLQTLSVRMERHCASTRLVAEFLESHPLVSRVFLPAVDGEQLTAYGGLLFFTLDVPRFADVQRFMQALELFDYGTSMASVASAVACPYHGSHLSMTAAEKARVGLDEFLVRLSIGLEEPSDLLGDLEQAFCRVSGGRQSALVAVSVGALAGEA